MIQDADLKGKLILQADIFQHHYRKKEYAEAKLIRERAGIVAVFIRLPEKERTELFGDRQGDEPIEGLFSEEQCIRAGFESIRRGFDMQRMTYEDVMAVVKRKSD